MSLSDLPAEIAAKRILSSADAAAFVGLSSRHWKRLRAAGEAPPAVRLSARKLGYSVEALMTWLAGRVEQRGAA